MLSGRMLAAMLGTAAATVVLQAIAAGYFRVAFQFVFNGPSFRTPFGAPAQLRTTIIGLLHSPQHASASFAGIASIAVLCSWMLFVCIDAFFGYRALALVRGLAVAWIPVLCALLQLVGEAATAGPLPALPGPPWTGFFGVVAAAVVTAFIAGALYVRPAGDGRADPAGPTGEVPAA